MVIQLLHGDDCGSGSGCAGEELNFSPSIHSVCGGEPLGHLHSHPELQKDMSVHLGNEMQPAAMATLAIIPAPLRMKSCRRAGG